MSRSSRWQRSYGGIATGQMSRSTHSARGGSCGASRLRSCSRSRRRILKRNGQRIGAESHSMGALKITKAVYGVLGDAKRTANVTEKVSSLVKGDMLRVRAANELVAKGDPAPLTRKKLRVDYELNGQSQSA